MSCLSKEKCTLFIAHQHIRPSICIDVRRLKLRAHTPIIVDLVRDIFDAVLAAQFKPIQHGWVSTANVFAAMGPIALPRH